MGLAQLQQWARAKYTHDRVRVSNGRPADLLQPDVNVVHLKRCSPVHPKHVRRQAEELGPGFRARVLAQTAAPRPAAQDLTQQLTVPEVREWLQDDISELISVFGEQLGYSEVSAKLEVLGATPCPRFHADHVGVRLLVTYFGPGTVYVENKHVRRRWLWDGAGGVAVEAVEPGAARQAAPGDLLFLKGHAAPENYGMGAVHRSPDLELDPDPDSGGASCGIPGAAAARHPDGERESDVVRPSVSPPLRLLLTVDDVVGWASNGCGCGADHGEAFSLAGATAGQDEAGAHRPDASLLV